MVIAGLLLLIPQAVKAGQVLDDIQRDIPQNAVGSECLREWLVFREVQEVVIEALKMNPGLSPEGWAELLVDLETARVRYQMSAKEPLSDPETYFFFDVRTALLEKLQAPEGLLVAANTAEREGEIYRKIARNPDINIRTPVGPEGAFSIRMNLTPEGVRADARSNADALNAVASNTQQLRRALFTCPEGEAIEGDYAHLLRENP